MPITCIVALVVALILIVIATNLEEEVFAPVITVSALLSMLVSIFTAPWMLKTIFLLVPLILIQVRLKQS